ncbi:AraC family transcriptional regulator [Salipaludibacillus sp. CF4.18]|uniref:AraC family transcriptional regulator n=1 Tax=Salipaludibacillus sp. CF4.18 TaxID=3373081 RepID=UPI003EE4FA70
MGIRYSDNNINRLESITDEHTFNEYVFPDMKIEFELYRMHVRSAKSTWNYPAHEHPLYEINLVTRGKQVFYIHGERYELEEGDLVLVRPGDVHSSSGLEKSEEGFNYFCVHFNIDDKLLLPYFKKTTDTFYHANSVLTRSIRPLLDRLINFSQQTKLSFADKMNLHSIMFELLAITVSCLEKDQKKHEKVSEQTFKVAYQIAQEIDQLIRKASHKEDIQESIVRIEEVANHLDISVSYCNKVFNKVFDMSPRQYVTFRKLNDSKSLLIQEKYSIEQIAFMMGYHDSSHFSRQFKRWTGLSPSQYRETQHSIPEIAET